MIYQKEVKMARQTIVISDEVYQQLMAYIDKNYGQNRRVLSMVIEKAVKEFLEKEGGRC
jgi:predicted CopG family antitoxin